jgi:hypothetical protein
MKKGAESRCKRAQRSVQRCSAETGGKGLSLPFPWPPRSTEPTESFWGRGHGVPTAAAHSPPAMVTGAFGLPPVRSHFGSSRARNEGRHEFPRDTWQLYSAPQSARGFRGDSAEWFSRLCRPVGLAWAKMVLYRSLLLLPTCPLH